MDYHPIIKSSEQLEESVVQGLRAVLHGNITAEGAVEYTYLLIVYGAQGDPVLYVSSEANTMRDTGGGSHFLGAFHETGHVNMGDSDEWADRSAFAQKATEVADRLLPGEEWGFMGEPDTLAVMTGDGFFMEKSEPGQPGSETLKEWADGGDGEEEIVVEETVDVDGDDGAGVDADPLPTLEFGSLYDAIRPRLDEMSLGDIDRLFRQLAEAGHQHGILALEDYVEGMGDPFLQRGLQMAVDGTEPDLIREILETWLESRVHECERKLRKAVEGIMEIQSGSNPEIVEAKLSAIY